METDQRHLLARMLHDEGRILRSFAAIERALRDEIDAERLERQAQHERLRADVEALRNLMTQGGGGAVAAVGSGFGGGKGTGAHGKGGGNGRGGAGRGGGQGFNRGGFVSA
eukprot:TRINITY_DN2623_c0_g2_i1.p2 TRINITY_DN2623_c0_g2~~TRINITY_DN2623_c0_g2_i1.p2  ORF type:complete len:111 (+),score=32.70 TRINITY_DN2623_c0_g2_i1:434-766(+)